jgi:exodeoxyribonuclease X
VEFKWQGRPLETMPFGMHRGRKIKDLPSDYRKWLLDKAHIGKSLRMALEKLSSQGGFVSTEYCS